MIQQLLQIESSISTSFGWPAWALRVIVLLSLLVGCTSILEATLSVPGRNGSNCNANRDNSTPTVEFRLFQLQYLSVYLTIMLADWLQGTNMYTLYTSYGVNVGTLFLTGFLSSAVFGTFLGIYVDAWGRKLGCIIFCALEIMINLLEHIPHMPLLMVGRVLGGLSTSLLFTAFESWMVSEHRKRGFNENWLASTFSISSWGNGCVAIIAGFLAQLSADVAGDIGPFQLAILLTVVTLVMICFWRENYGTSHVHESCEESAPPQAGSVGGATGGAVGAVDGSVASCSNSANSDASDTGGADGASQPPHPSSSIGSESTMSMVAQMRGSLMLIVDNPEIMYLGLSQAFFEGAMYTFVFMWVPSMLEVTQGSLPTGLVFSAFMLCMTLGGMLFGLLLPIFPGGAEGLMLFVYMASALAMLVPAVSFEFWHVVLSFLLLEAMVGMFNSCGATLRSRYYPEGLQSSLMSVFRLPLNLLVVIGTKLSDGANDVPSLQRVFALVVGMHVIAGLLHVGLLHASCGSNNNSSEKEKID